MQLDRLDKMILKTLQENGRTSSAELAEKLGSSKTACWSRIKQLQEAGYITQFKAILNPEKLGLLVLVTIGVVLDRSTPESFATFEKAVKKIPAIQECLLLAGEFDYWLKVRVKDIQAFNRLHSNALLSLPGVRQLRTFFVLNEATHTQDVLVE